MKNQVAAVLSSSCLPRTFGGLSVRTVVAAFLMFLSISGLRAEPFFVDPAAPSGGDGLSWATAFENLPAAVEAAHEDISAGGGAISGATAEIWVKAGTFE